MLVRLGVTSLTLMLAVSPLVAQVGARSTRRAAFTFNVTPFVGLGFRGRRAASDPGDGTCTTGRPCIDHKIGSGPAVGADLQLPLTGNFGLGVTGSISRPKQVVCVRGNCSSRETVTALRGAAMLLLRLKARVPVYFGFGAAMFRFDPGAVVGQNDTETEYGGVLVIGYDFAPGAKVGGRVAWTNYFMSPSSNSLPGGFEASGIAYDAVITIGARIGL